MADEMVTIATFGNPLQAEAMKNHLEAEGIPAFVTGGEAGGLFAGMGGAFGLVSSRLAATIRSRAATDPGSCWMSRSMSNRRPAS